MPSLLISVLFAFSGCIQLSPGEQHDVVASSPSETDSAEQSVGLRMRDCKGALTLLALPGQLVRPYVPDVYSFDLAGETIAFVHLQTNHCREDSVDGSGVQEVSISFVLIDVLYPPGARPGPDYDANYVVEVRTNSISVRDWLQARGLSVENGSVERNWAQASTYVSTLTSTPTSDQRMLYRVDGLTDPRTFSEDDRRTYYFGPNPRTDFLNDRWLQEWSGSFASTLVMDKTTVISQMLGGATMSAAGTQVLDATFRALTPPDRSVK